MYPDLLMYQYAGLVYRVKASIPHTALNHPKQTGTVTARCHGSQVPSESSDMHALTSASGKGNEEIFT